MDDDNQMDDYNRKDEDDRTDATTNDGVKHRAEVGQVLHHYVVANIQAQDPGHSAIEPADATTWGRLHSTWGLPDANASLVHWMLLLDLLRFALKPGQPVDDATIRRVLNETYQERTYRPMLDYLGKLGSIASLASPGSDQKYRFRRLVQGPRITFKNSGASSSVFSSAHQLKLTVLLTTTPQNKVCLLLLYIFAFSHT